VNRADESRAKLAERGGTSRCSTRAEILAVNSSAARSVNMKAMTDLASTPSASRSATH
jgi:hypothetical protein